jgi:heat shock protein HslJ
VPFTARATLVFGPGDSVGGQGPCNRWSADLISTLPAFQIGPIVATEMACDDLVAEMTFFRTLALMSEATFQEGLLVLTGYQGSSMVFQKDP